MNMKNFLKLTLFFGILLFISCNRVDDEDIFVVDGLKPVYSTTNWQEITVTGPQGIEHLGKIYYKDGILYVNERNKGIHVVDDNDPFNINALKFINIPGNRDIAIKGNILYADNGKDLVALDISNFDDIKVVNRISNVYPDRIFLEFPENYFGYFECVDPEKGVVVGWEETTLENPECWR